MRVESIPNIITIIRLILIIPILWTLLGHDYRSAFYVFVIAGFSDGLDGFLARRYQWTSRFGAVVDPIADKFLMLATFIALAWSGAIPSWVLLLVVGRDILIVVGVLIYRYCFEEPAYAPSFLSKINTFFQILFVLVILWHYGITTLPFGLITSMMYLMVISTILSFVNYCILLVKRALQIRTYSQI